MRRTLEKPSLEPREKEAESGSKIREPKENPAKRTSLPKRRIDRQDSLLDAALDGAVRGAKR